MKKLIALSIATACSTAVVAETPETGFGGEIGLGMSYFSNDGNFNTANENNLTSTQETLDAEAEINPELLGELNYTFGNEGNHQVFAGTNNEEVIQGDVALEFGYRTQFADESSLSVSYLTSMINEETWKDPYLINSKREITEISESGFMVEYANIAGSAFAVDALYYSSDVEDEQSGQGQVPGDINTLKRSGSGFDLGLAYEVALTTDSVLIPRLTYGSYSADGEAFSNTSIGGELTYMKMIDNHAFGLQGYYNSVSFDGANVAFDDVTRSDSEYGVAALYEYEGFMGWEDVTFIGLAGYDAVTSNINFYEETEYQIGAALSYSF